jgi:excisionase family DNA binding protein
MPGHIFNLYESMVKGVRMASLTVKADSTYQNKPMDNIPKIILNINFTGQITIDATQLDNLSQGPQVPEPEQPLPEPITPTVIWPAKLTYSTQEAADLLGITSKTVYRLVERGMLKAVSALRHKRIPRTEIERFLRETTE